MHFTIFIFLLQLFTQPVNPPQFEAQVLDDNVAIGYGLAIGDVDGDGISDYSTGSSLAGSSGIALVFSGATGELLHRFDGFKAGDGLGGAVLNQASNAALQLFNLRFSRQTELKADDRGLQILTQAGYRPMAAVETLQILQAAAPGSSMPEFLRSHPLSESRIQALAQQYQAAQNR